MDAYFKKLELLILLHTLRTEIIYFYTKIQSDAQKRLPFLKRGLVLMEHSSREKYQLKPTMEKIERDPIGKDFD
jgi:hypothetical protein